MKGWKDILRVEAEIKRFDPSFQGFYHGKKYLDTFDTCIKNYEEIMAQMLEESQGKQEDMVNCESPKFDVFIDNEEHEEQDDPSETSAWTGQSES